MQVAHHTKTLQAILSQKESNLVLLNRHFVGLAAMLIIMCRGSHGPGDLQSGLSGCNQLPTYCMKPQPGQRQQPLTHKWAYRLCILEPARIHISSTVLQLQLLLLVVRHQPVCILPDLHLELPCPEEAVVGCPVLELVLEEPHTCSCMVRKHITQLDCKTRATGKCTVSSNPLIAQPLFVAPSAKHTGCGPTTLQQQA